jgi:hypothetical protein
MGLVQIAWPADTSRTTMSDTEPAIIVQFHPRPAQDRCAHCGSPQVDVPAYPRSGRRRACLAGWSAPQTLGALPCGAARWSDRAA